MDSANRITASDVKVLRYFREHSPASASDAKKALSDAVSVEHRIAALTKPAAGLLAEDTEVSYESMQPLHKGLGIYRITPKGEIVLDDYLVEQRRHWRELLLKSLWFPIAVSFATALLTTLLTLMLAGL